MNSLRRRSILMLLICLIVLGVGTYYAAFRVFPPDEEDVANLLAETLSYDEFRYAMTATVTTGEGEIREYFSLEGAVSGDNAFVSGEVLGTPLELARVDSVYYQKGSDGMWRTIEESGNNAVANLFAELDPAAAFAYSGLTGFSYVGVVESDDGRVQRVTIIPEQTGWIAQYFTDVVYTLDFDRTARTLLSAQVDATLKEDTDTHLAILASFYDIGKSIDIEVPGE